MLEKALEHLKKNRPAPHAEAHCDGPCGVYDPASVRIAAEAAVSMTKKILALTPPDPSDAQAMAAYLNTLSRYVAIKEEQALPSTPPPPPGLSTDHWRQEAPPAVPVGLSALAAVAHRARFRAGRAAWQPRP